MQLESDGNTVFWLNPDTRWEISGWAVDRTSLDRVVPIQLWVAGQLVAKVQANRHKAHIAKRFGGDGRHGFRIILPMRFYDGEKYPALLINGDTEQVLSSFELATADLRAGADVKGVEAWYGVVLQASERSIGGWVLDNSDPSVVGHVELLVDGEVVSMQAADISLSLLPFKGEHNRHMFEFRIPSRFYDDGTHDFAVRLRETCSILPAPSVSLRLSSRMRPRWSSELSADSDGILRGTVTATLDGAPPIMVLLYSGDASIQTIRVKSGVAFEFDVLSAALARGIELTSRLRVLVEQNGESLPVEGVDPLAAGIKLTEVALDGATARFGLRLSRFGRASYRFVLLVDGRRAGAQEVVVEDGRDAALSFNLSERPGRIQLTLGDGVTSIPGGDFRAATGVGAFDVMSRRGTAGPPVWVDPSEYSLHAILSARVHGMVPADLRAGYSGSWSLDHEAKRIIGWVVNTADALRPLDVELLANDVTVGRIKADDAQGIMLSGRKVLLPSGFEFDLSVLPTGQGELVTLTVRIVEAPSISFGTPAVYAEGKKWIGKIELVTWHDFQLNVTGWIVEVAHPGRPIEAHLRDRDTLLASSIAREYVDVTLADATQIKALSFRLSCLHGSPETSTRLSVAASGAATVWPLPLPQSLLVEQELLPVSARSAVAVKPGDVIRGNVEAISASGVKGWATNINQPDSVPDLILKLNGTPLAHARPSLHRSDIEAIYGGHGFSGFYFEMQPNSGWVVPFEIEIEPVKGVSEISIKTQPQALLSHAIAASESIYAARSLISATARGRVQASLIVLNKDGADVLRELFRTASLHEDTEGLEWIVIDHQSADASQAVCADANAEGMNVRFVRREGNYSFSASNNFGAALAKHDSLIFINNDIEFREPVLGALLAQLEDADVGLVGLKLLDALPDRDDPRTPIQHLGVYFNPTLPNHLFRPFEARLTTEVAETNELAVEVPATTGALLAVRRDVFETIGGFNEHYFYGYEDVDLCLKVSQMLGKKVVNLNNCAAVHHRGFTRSDGRQVDPRRRNNNLVFNTQWGSHLRLAMRRDVLERPGFWHGHRPVIGFAVTEPEDNAAAGDYFTALELGRAMQRRMPVHLAFLGRSEWADLSGVDILIAMVDGFDLGKVEAARPHLQVVAWARNWFDRWCERPSIRGFDQVWASSQRGANYMAERLGIPVPIVRIATNPDTFANAEPEAGYRSDYCFTGSRFNVSRDIEFELKPRDVHGRGALFGHNWEQNADFMEIARGPVSYSKMPAVYASSLVVLDDANFATKHWGSCNSRVFDALGAGRLVITNGEEGAREVFGDLLPTWLEHGSLAATVNYWLEHPQERTRRTELLREMVLEHHTYDARATQTMHLLQRASRSLTFAIKIAAPAKNASEWGDFHFANGLAAALRSIGHRARVDLRESWYKGLSDTDDVVIVLRGLIAYEPRPHQKNFLWIISHPDEVSPKEIARYDRVFVASRPYADVLRRLTDSPIDVMLQCTDARRFNPDTSDFGARSANILFVGNSRNVEREAVRWAIDGGLDLSLYGAGWSTFVPPGVLKGRYVPNEVLADLYRKANWVLCDHWADMKRNGFISNRVFDVLAAGGSLIVDDVTGLEDEIPGGYRIYRSREEFLRLAGEAPLSLVERRAHADWIMKYHSFDARAEVFSEVAKSALKILTSCLVPGFGGAGFV